MLVSLPKVLPLVILRGSGETTAQLSRLAAENGVRALAHAEGGGVLYVHPAASREKALAITEASLDRLGVCNRLNLLLVDRAARGLLPELLTLLDRLGLEVRGTPRAAAVAEVVPLDVRLGHEWANDADRVSTVTLDVVDDLDEAVRLANEETSGLAAGIVTEDADAAQAVPRRLPRHGRLLARADPVHRRLRADRRARDRDQRRLGARPARPRHLPGPLAAPVPDRR